MITLVSKLFTTMIPINCVPMDFIFQSYTHLRDKEKNPVWPCKTTSPALKQAYEWFIEYTVFTACVITLLAHAICDIVHKTRRCHLGTCYKSSCNRSQTISQWSIPQNRSEAGQQSRRFEGIKPTIKNSLHLKSSLLDYTYLRRSKGCSARCLKPSKFAVVRQIYLFTVCTNTRLQAQALTVAGRNN